MYSKELQQVRPTSWAVKYWSPRAKTTSFSLLFWWWPQKKTAAHVRSMRTATFLSHLFNLLPAYLPTWFLYKNESRLITIIGINIMGTLQWDELWILSIHCVIDLLLGKDLLSRVTTQGPSLATVRHCLIGEDSLTALVEAKNMVLKLSFEERA